MYIHGVAGDMAANENGMHGMLATDIIDRIGHAIDYFIFICRMTLSLILLLANVLVSITCFRNRELFFKLDFQPYMIVQNKQWYRFISHAFVHADGFHLVVNMYVLYCLW